jgi:hypothetical protein
MTISCIQTPDRVVCDVAGLLLGRVVTPVALITGVHPVQESFSLAIIHQRLIANQNDLTIDAQRISLTLKEQ